MRACGDDSASPGLEHMQQDTLDSLMERTIVPGFSRIGVAVRRRRDNWVPLEGFDLSERVVVLTGGTSGIGEAASRWYARLGATLVLLARDEQKVKDLIEQLKHDTGNHDLHAVIADLGDQTQVNRAADDIIQRFPRIDVLAHNAGALFNERRRTGQGTDLSVELMVAAPFLLTCRLLTPLGHGASATASPRPFGPGRVITMSSGGMYAEGLQVETLEMSDEQYSGVRQYARAKRAQVILNALWAERLSADELVFHALHPGWVDTPGIGDALPGFVRVLRPLGLLRPAEEGADTLIWLSASDEAGRVSGRFWHDRKPRPIDMKQSTRDRDTTERREALWTWCERHTGCRP